VRKEQLLRRDRAGGVDDDLLSVLDGFVEENLNIREEGSDDVARLVSLKPEVSLKRLEVRYLDIALHEIADVSFKVRRRVAVLLRESITVLCKLWTVPLLFQDFGKCFECIRELGTANRPWSAGCTVVDVGHTIANRGKVGEGIKEAGVEMLGSKKKKKSDAHAQRHEQLGMTWFGSLDAEKWMSKAGIWTEEVRDERLGRNLMGSIRSSGPRSGREGPTDVVCGFSGGRERKMEDGKRDGCQVRQDMQEEIAQLTKTSLTKEMGQTVPSVTFVIMTILYV
jgi:hypothetical protein